MTIILEINGTLFCDWRVKLHDCENSNFFFVCMVIVLAFVTVAYVVQVIMVLDAIFVKRFPFRELLKGNKLYVIFSFGNFTVLMLQLCAVVFADQNGPLCEMLWGLNVPTNPLFLLVVIENLSEVLPSFEASYKDSIGHLSRTARALLCLAVGVIFVIVNTTLFGFVTYYSSIGDEVKRAFYFQVAMAFASFLYIFILALFAYFGISFVLLLSKELQRDIPKAITRKELETVVKQQKAVIFFNTTVNTLLIAFFLLLAFNDYFFSNLGFSKTLCLLFCIFYVSVAPFFISLFVMSLKQSREKMKISQNRSSGVDQSVTN